MRHHSQLSLKIILVLFALIPSMYINAQETEPVIIGEKYKLYSNVLNEERELWIYKPPSYNSVESNKYPVIYLLDASYQYHHITGIVEFLASGDLMPETIVVALPNTDRTRDLTPPTQTDSTNAFPTAGGADNFFNFLGDELIPYIDANFRTHPHRTLVGHSFGGLFAIHALLNCPQAFNNYIATSPSLWWNNGQVIQDAASFFEKKPELSGCLYMTMGNEGGTMLGNTWRLAAILEECAPDSFQWKFEIMDKETHNSIPHRSTYQAFEAIYADWNIPDVINLVKSSGVEAVDSHYDMLSKKYGYTISTPEHIINRLGYWYLEQKENEKAITLFERNVQNYPESANVYDSLADAYKANKQFERAKENYIKAVERAEATKHANLDVYKSNLQEIEKSIYSHE